MISKARVQHNVNKYIRKRDEGKPCISCGNNKGSEAGHYIAVGQCDALRFDLDNIHLQCHSCNYHKHGNQMQYRLNLVNRIGAERVEALERKFLQFKRMIHKWDQFTLKDINQKALKGYKELTKSFVL